MDLDHLPKPSDLASILTTSPHLAKIRQTLAIIADNRPHLIALTPQDIDRWRNITQTIKRIPYYGFTLLLAQIEDISYCTDNVIWLWDSVRNHWNQYQRPIPKEIPRPFEQTKDNQTMITRPTQQPTAIPTPADLEKQLQPTYKGQDGQTRRIGYLPLTVANVLGILALNAHNRRPNWGHILTLIGNWRTDWIPETSLLTVSWKKLLEDGQHRLISFVLAFGTQAEVAQLLLMIASWTNSRFSLPEGTQPDEVYTDPVKFVPIKDYSLYRGVMPDFDKFIPVQMNASPRVGEKADSDQRKRTGAEMLGKNADIADTCSRWGVSEETIQTIIRTMYLRCLPPTTEAKEDGSKYGTIRKGGNIQPARYIALFRVFGEYIGKALELIANSETWSAQDSVIPLHHLIANIALAMQGKVSDKKIAAFLDEWTGLTPVTQADGTTSYDWKPRTNMAKVAEKMKTDKDKRLSPMLLCYIPSFCLNSKDQNPTCNTPNQLLALMGEGQKDEKGKAISIEQQPLNRIPGWDSDGCKEILTASLVKKLKAEQNKSERKKTAAK